MEFMLSICSPNQTVTTELGVEFTQLKPAGCIDVFLDEQLGEDSCRITTIWSWLQISYFNSMDENDVNFVPPPLDQIFINHLNSKKNLSTFAFPNFFTKFNLSATAVQLNIYSVD